MTDEGLLDTRYGVKGVTYTWNEDRATLTLTQDATDDMANGSKNYALGSCMLLDNYARRGHWETMLSLCFLPDFRNAPAIFRTSVRLQQVPIHLPDEFFAVSCSVRLSVKLF